MANEKRLKLCGDCIHADICKEVNGGWFSPKNPAYCKGFKDRTKYVEVVRCKDCKYFVDTLLSGYGCSGFGGMTRACPNGFCSHGERKDNDI
jgi:hypothetical protein